ncbi:MAG TPA: DinB family protein [Longimicrobiales bacterium]
MSVSTMTAAGRPDRSEYAEYYHRYVSLVPDGNVIDTLATQFAVTRRLLETVAPERESWAYAPGKWSFREVVGHLADVERVFAGRVLWIARDPDTPLPSMEQDAWAANSAARERPLRDLLDEWSAARQATVALVRGLDAEALARTGTASGVRFTVRSIPWIIAGHELHHRRLLRERYGLSADS